MKPNIREPELSEQVVALDEPHFDEEATLLSARPVVPLEVVKQESRSRRRWGVAAVIAGALLIGALSAAVTYQLSGPTGASAVDTTKSAQTGPVAVEARISAFASEDPSPPAPQTAVNNVPSETTTSTTPTVTPRKPVAASRTPTRPAQRNEDRIAEQQELQKEVRRAEKRENRRLRRAEREARHDEAVRSDDLLRIREIFEGAPRP